MNLAEAAYRTTARFPREEAYGLTAQLRRSAASVPANIAEGYGRDSKGAYVQHLRVAQGSLKEFETHLLLAERVGLVDNVILAPLLAKSEMIGKMLRSLIRSIENSDERL
jgi:four helix bundle protein